MAQPTAQNHHEAPRCGPWLRELPAPLRRFARWVPRLLVGGLVAIGGCSHWGGRADEPALAVHGSLPSELANGSTVEAWAQRVASEASLYSDEQADRVSQQIVEYLPREEIAWNRHQLVTALGQLGTPAALGGLENGLADPTQLVRQAACRGLANVQRDEAIRLLGQALSTDTDLDVRLAAARALGAHRRPAAVIALAAALDDPDPALRYRAIQSMEMASGEKFGGDAAAWKQYAAQLMLQP